MSICTSCGPVQLEIKVFSDDDKCEQDWIWWKCSSGQ